MVDRILPHPLEIQVRSRSGIVIDCSIVKVIGQGKGNKQRRTKKKEKSTRCDRGKIIDITATDTDEKSTGTAWKLQNPRTAGLGLFFRDFHHGGRLTSP